MDAIELTGSHNISILLVDDHILIREGLAKLLESDPQMHVIGQAGNGRSGIQLARQLEPDVVIMDLAMPDISGIDATREIRAMLPDAKILILSIYSDWERVVSVLQAGAMGYVLKSCRYQELAQAICTVAQGKRYLDPHITGIVLDDYLKRLGANPQEPDSPLSDRENEVLRLLARGLTSKEIAAHLFLSVKTVETHRRNIMKKVEIHTVAGLTKYAMSRGIS
ncbi:MAG: response regulator [Armatimonadota bacterium]